MEKWKISLDLGQEKVSMVFLEQAGLSRSYLFTVGLAAVLCLIRPMELVNVCGRRKEKKDENRSNGKMIAETFWLGRESYNSLSLEGQARICGASGVFCHYNILLI